MMATSVMATSVMATSVMTTSVMSTSVMALSLIATSVMATSVMATSVMAARYRTNKSLVLLQASLTHTRSIPSYPLRGPTCRAYSIPILIRVGVRLRTDPIAGDPVVTSWQLDGAMAATADGTRVYDVSGKLRIHY